MGAAKTIIEKMDMAKNELAELEKQLRKAESDVAAVQVKLSYVAKVVKAEESVKAATKAHGKSEVALAKAKEARILAKDKVKDAQTEAQKKNAEASLKDAIAAIAGKSKDFDFTLGIKTQKLKDLAELK